MSGAGAAAYPAGNSKLAKGGRGQSFPRAASPLLLGAGLTLVLGLCHYGLPRLIRHWAGCGPSPSQHGMSIQNPKHQRQSQAGSSDSRCCDQGDETPNASFPFPQFDSEIEAQRCAQQYQNRRKGALQSMNCVGRTVKPQLNPTKNTMVALILAIFPPFYAPILT